MTLSEKNKNFFNGLVRLTLSVILLVYIFSQIDIPQTAELVKKAKLIYIFYALLVFVFIHYLLLLRWQIYIKALELPAPFINVLRFFFIGLFGNLFLPTAIGGDVIKTIGLCTQSAQKPKVVASVLLDRLSGFFGMVVVATGSFVFGFQLINDWSLAVFIILMALASSSIAAVLFNETLYSFCCRIFSAFPRLKKGLMEMHYDIALLKDRRGAIYQSVAVSAFCQILLAFDFYLVAKSLHQDIPFIYFLVFVPLICVAACFPSIGGLGVREVGSAFLFGKIGIDSGVAVSVSLTNFLYMVIVGVGGWLFFVLTKSRSARQGEEAGVENAGSSPR